MRAVVQRVTSASVTVAGEVIGTIDRGLVVLLGVAQSDTEADANYLADKIVGLRTGEDRSWAGVDRCFPGMETGVGG